MTRLLIVAAICVIAAPAIASPDVLPHRDAGVWQYDLATGEQTPASRVLGPHIWGPTESSGWFSSMELAGNDVWLDWADLGNLGYSVGGFGWYYATNANHGSIDLILCFYGDDNGRNTSGRDIIAVFGFDGLKGTITPNDRNVFWGRNYRAELYEPFLMTCNDLDGDALGDWSYTYWFDMAVLAGPPARPSPIIGPGIAGDPAQQDNIPGVYDAFDIFNEPNYVPTPGYVDPNLTNYRGTYWFQGVVYSQFYMELMAPGCPNKGDAGRYCQADINGTFDCIVNLPDLAQLLGHYGCGGPDPNNPTEICTKSDGDVAPYHRWFPGNGIINIADLAELLGQYGDDCNPPPP